MIKNRTHLILALLYAASDVEKELGAIEGITRLEKLLFLVNKESRLSQWQNTSEQFNFKPYLMGPFSSDIYDEIDFLESLDLISSKKTGANPPAESVEDQLFFSNQILDKYQKNEIVNKDETRVYQLTAKGKQRAKKIFDSLPQDEKDFLINLKKKYGRLTLKQLLRYIYQKYPSYASKSEIKEYLGVE